MEEKRISVWKLHTLCMITGASRGLGKCIAVRFAERFPSGSVMILAARDNGHLYETKHSIEQIRPDIKVFVWSIDLTEIDKEIVEQYLSSVWLDIHQVPSDFEQTMLIHNAGSLGNITEWFTGQSSAGELNKYWQLNLTSVAVLNSVFWSLCRNQQQRVAINISSLCAKKAFKSYSLYCTG